MTRTSNPSTAHRLCSLRISGGFLDGLALDFASGLNCLIGARGSGKTTVLELVRFALDALPPASDPESRRIEALIQSNLADGVVELVIETREGLQYTVRRAFGEDPLVLAADGQATAITLRSGGLFRADIYSQNEVERIADRALSQLSLLDNFEGEQIAAVSARIRAIESKLSNNASATTPSEQELAGLNEQIATLPGVEEKLKGYVTSNPDTSHGEAVEKAQVAKALRDRESQAMEAAWSCLQEQDRELEQLQGKISNQGVALLTRDLTAGPNAKSMAAVRHELLDCGAEVDDLLRSARRRIEQMQSWLTDAGNSLSSLHAQQEQVYQALLDKDKTLRGRAAERVKLERLKSDLLTKQRKCEVVIDKLAKLQRERTELLHQLSELRDQRFSIRQGVAKRINAVLSPAIRVTINQSGHMDQYRAMLEESLRNSRLRHGVVAERLIEAFSPVELVAAIRRGDAAELRTRANLSDEQSRKVVDTLAGTDLLFSIETVELADRPLIELRDGEEYKSSGALSTGQKCTAILPILLLDRDNPLLVDQPEDNLDNRFVCECIVESILKIKGKRQLIFVTHNPNIPVIGEADQVLVMQSDGAHASKVAEGDVDECKDAIVTLLEGGEDAFKRRKERYAY